MDRRPNFKSTRARLQAKWASRVATAAEPAAAVAAPKTAVAAAAAAEAPVAAAAAAAAPSSSSVVAAAAAMAAAALRPPELVDSFVASMLHSIARRTALTDTTQALTMSAYASAGYAVEESKEDEPPCAAGGAGSPPASFSSAETEVEEEDQDQDDQTDDEGGEYVPNSGGKGGSFISMCILPGVKPTFTFVSREPDAEAVLHDAAEQLTIYALTPGTEGAAAIHNFITLHPSGPASDAVFARNSDGFTPIMEAARSVSTLAALGALLTDQRVKFKLALTRCGSTAAAIAVSNSNVEGLAMLLTAWHGCLDLHHAVAVGNAVCARVDGTPQELVLCATALGNTHPKLWEFWDQVHAAAKATGNDICAVFSELCLRVKPSFCPAKADLEAETAGSSTIHLFWWVPTLRRAVMAGAALTVSGKLTAEELAAPLAEDEQRKRFIAEGNSAVFSLGQCTGHKDSHTPAAAFKPRGSAYDVFVAAEGGGVPDRSSRDRCIQIRGVSPESLLEFVEKVVAGNTVCAMEAISVFRKYRLFEMETRLSPSASAPEFLACARWLLHKPVVGPIEHASRLVHKLLSDHSH